jgi:hypothetical protein
MNILSDFRHADESSTAERNNPKKAFEHDMLFHHTSPSAIRPGDHLYVWRGLRMVQGIVVRCAGDDPAEIDVVTRNDVNSFHLITCDAFQYVWRLRRVVYEDARLLHWIKISGTSFTEAPRPAEEIVRNALLLLDVAGRDPQRIEKVIMDNFARFCSTTQHDKWRSILVGNGENVGYLHSSRFILF